MIPLDLAHTLPEAFELRSQLRVHRALLLPVVIGVVVGMEPEPGHHVVNAGVPVVHGAWQA